MGKLRGRYCYIIPRGRIEHEQNCLIFGKLGCRSKITKTTETIAITEGKIWNITKRKKLLKVFVTDEPDIDHDKCDLVTQPY